VTDIEAREQANEILQGMIEAEESLPGVSNEVLTELIAAFLANALQEVYSRGFNDGLYEARSDE